MDDAQIPVTGLEELESHLEQIVDDSETPLNVKLFDEVEVQLNDGNIPPLIPRLLPNLTQILLTYDKDPTIFASLSIKLLRPIKFTEALTLASEDALIQALESPAPSANILAITVLAKASRSPSDTAILSIMKGVVGSFVRRWLSTPHVEVGEKATQALGDLLEVDCDRRSSAGIDTKMSGMQLAGTPSGQGLLWRRIFQDRDIYGLIFSLCSSKTIGTGEEQLDERQKSLAQGRLLRLLPRLSAFDFHTVTRTQFPEIERQYGLQDGEHGLLFFAMVDMVDKQDILMHLNLIDLFIEFLEKMSTAELTQPTLDYLASLTKKVAGSDGALYKTLEAIGVSPDSPPELVDLLVTLSRHE